MKVRMLDFGFAIVFCTECAMEAASNGLLFEFEKLGGDSYKIQPRSEEG